MSPMESPLDKIKGKVKEVIKPPQPSKEEIREEIWKDLSDLYYKYNDPQQKHVFREVLKEICEKIGEDKWHNVYQKLYRDREST
jgi:hypothetical protein